MSWLVALSCLGASGCATTTSAQSAPRIGGTLMMSAQHDLLHGARIRVVTRAVSKVRHDCDDTESCVQRSEWRPVQTCGAVQQDLRVTMLDYDVPFEACATAGGEVDVLAFIDLDDDGTWSPGEPVGRREGIDTTEGLSSLVVRIR